MNSSLIYTICSANNLYQAFALGFSLKKTNPDYRFVIGLIDKKPQTDFEYPFSVISIDELHHAPFREMSERYSIIELNCACKPVFAKYFLNYFPNTELIYMDTDIWVMNNIDEIITNLVEKDYDIILTPHITRPIGDQEEWSEKNFLNAGLYNAGFFALKKTENTIKMLDWWENRLFDRGYLDYCKGMGADQLWLNFVPLFFEKVLVEYNPGYNLAYWNLNEREISLNPAGQYMADAGYPVKFFHFSGFSPEMPNLISRHLPKTQIQRYPVLKELFNEYQRVLLENHYYFFKGIVPAYGIYTPPAKPKGLVSKLIDKGSWKVINFIENFEV
ncbi:hypothetical protein SAMN04515674_11749 [Pseudarcicella hirudinis]|uniref:Glycosyl transferase family 8 n=1 Tax=Pseudarcicella hirudinis TaxID=1079859 RepID=A0A1I5Y6I3_9BACT|nr:hypothetical protein [Pseudarcicella hirudinis]SFQ39808.1 hypothetical protein SAMN04515674_11749 [Pseudarcicella hirudinis]